MATAQVISSVEAIVFPGNSFRNWVKTDDSIRNFIFETMALRLVDVMTLIEEVAFRKMDIRLADFLLQKFLSTEITSLPLSITHEQIAAELGTAREVISRILKDFDRLGAIRVSRGHITLQEERLLREIKETGN
jgi:CRP/FNR family transcriptional regulator